ncbi:Transposase and inactivated derivatives [Sphingobacterium spiritivorum]|uniref:Transposase and inactivated derivatives n=1 Tax=Sphingobacterium spiritivorum TaxID=258 RepID=A0A380CNG6_SPHSI|nr:transposase [Sphingobacterium spiritivorum]SUJ24710.1 Transposase and inactivated derivatives [Sphingobacterium spiritivorum]
MSTKYKIRNQSLQYFVSFATVYWVDLFTRNEYRKILLDSLAYCQKEKGLEIYAWCIMTSHVHLIIGTTGNKMEDILRDFKSYTSQMLRKEITENFQENRKEWLLWLMERAGKKNRNNKDFQLWQQNNHPIELWDNYMKDQKLEYLHQNPVASGFVSSAENYIYSSARDYMGEKGLLEIKLLE